MEIEVTHLNKEDITIILNEAFECPCWNENNAIDIVDKLLGFGEVSKYNSELCRSIEKFINKEVKK